MASALHQRIGSKREHFARIRATQAHGSVRHRTLRNRATLAHGSGQLPYGAIIHCVALTLRAADLNPWQDSAYVRHAMLKSECKALDAETQSELMPEIEAVCVRTLTIFLKVWARWVLQFRGTHKIREAHRSQLAPPPKSTRRRLLLHTRSGHLYAYVKNFYIATSGNYAKPSLVPMVYSQSKSSPHCPRKEIASTCIGDSGAPAVPACLRSSSATQH